MSEPEASDLKAIATALAAEGNPWSSGVTSMTQLSAEDCAIRLGVPPNPSLPDDDPAIAVAAAAVTAVQGVTAPTSFDVRNVNGVNYDGKVKDQGSCGSCVAFGTVATIEDVFRFTKRTTMPLDLSEAQMFYVWGRSQGATCGTGWWPDQALTFARDKGVTFEDYYPYTAGDQDGNTKVNPDWPNRLAKVTAFETISGDVAKMKDAISNFGAITVCLNVYNDFFSYRSGVYRHVTGALAGGHCVVLIGYDDAAGCWIGRNSWGTSWGDSGYFRIAYGQCGIESYRTCSVSGVNLRAWLPAQTVSGLWSNQADANLWAAGAQRGWLKLDSSTAPTQQAMLADLAAAKGLGRSVTLFEDSGSIKQIYA